MLLLAGCGEKQIAEPTDEGGYRLQKEAVYYDDQGSEIRRRTVELGQNGLPAKITITERESAEESWAEAVWTLSYGEGNQITGAVLTEDGTDTQYIFNEYGDVVQHSYQSDSGTQDIKYEYVYDDGGNLLEYRQYQGDSLILSRVMEYDERGTILTEHLSNKANGAERTTSYENEYQDNLLSKQTVLIDGEKQQAYIYKYNDDNLLIRKETEDATNFTVWEYDDKGRLYKYTDNQTSFYLTTVINSEIVYDENGLIKEKTYTYDYEGPERGEFLYYTEATALDEAQIKALSFCYHSGLQQVKNTVRFQSEWGCKITA